MIERNHAREVRGPRPPRKLVSFLPIDEATQLVEGRAVAGASRPRDVAILELLYASGLRVSELSGLDLDDAGPDGPRRARARQGTQGADRPLRRQGAPWRWTRGWPNGARSRARCS